MAEKELEKCYFLPMSTLNKVVDFIETKVNTPNHYCKRNLLDLNLNRCVPTVRRQRWRNMYQMAITRAVYGHDWNKLLFLLKKSPPWEHQSRKPDQFPLYIRALTILLMNHPSARTQGLLNDYLHLVLACRSDEDKRAVLKTILTLPEKLLKPGKDEDED